MNNNKRKLVSNSFNKLKKVSLSVFEDEDIDDVNKQDNANPTIITKNEKTSLNLHQDPVLTNEQRDVITKTSQWMVNNPNQRNILMEKSKENPMLSFLFEPQSIAGKFYLKELQRLQTEKEVQSICSGNIIPVLPNIMNTTLTNNVINNQQSLDTIERKNRWGPKVEKNSAIEATSTISQHPNEFNHNHVDITSFDSHANMNESSSQSEQVRYQKLLKEQKELQLLESRIREANQKQLYGGSAKNITEIAQYLTKNATKNNLTTSSSMTISSNSIGIAEQQAELYLERLNEYEELARLDDDNNNYRDTIDDAERNGGIIEGGTWEHRKRAKEMLKTAAKNLELTLMASGKHHMADYLPPEVLNQFLKNAELVSKGGTNIVDEAQKSSATTIIDSFDSYTSHKLTADNNIGYQLLTKSGWTEGKGLGATSSGITQPLTAGSAIINNNLNNNNNTSSNNNNTSNSSNNPFLLDGSGIGTRATHEVEVNDNEFDQYRKRMMLAYRFRPNPLNNPRRDYY